MTGTVRRRRRGVGSLGLLSYTPGMLFSDLGITFTGIAGRTYIDQNGVRQTVGLNTPRDGHYVGGVRTLLLEAARTMYFANSGAPVTQTTPSLPIGTYCLWMVGTGSIAVTAGTAVITGAGSATSAVPLVFSVTTAGTVTCTITGSVTLAQLESGGFPSSYFAVTAVPTTRTAEDITFPFARPVQSITIYSRFIDLGSQAVSAGILEVGQFATNPAVVIYFPAATTFSASFHNGTVQVNGGTFSSGGVVSGDTVEARAILTPSGTVQPLITRNLGVEVGGTVSGAAALPASNWGLNLIRVNKYTGSGNGFMAFQRLTILTGVQSLGSMRAA